ncbi:MAG: ATP-binding cassette domain-containing protein [Anaerolineales bacterium]|nr:ATP-binding cassette domain-containing protein [Anaerolineales bacterium]
MIEIRNLNKNFGNHIALQNLSVDIKQGELISIVGPNGAGKTTLLRTIAGLCTTSDGNLYINKVTSEKLSLSLKSQIGFVSSEPYLFENLTVSQNLNFFAELYGIGNKENRINELMHVFEISEKRDDLVINLSRGYQQRTSLVRAFLPDPSILLLDEPFSGLDQGSASLLQKELLQHSKNGNIILLATHDQSLDVIKDSRCLALEEGRLIYDGPYSGLIQFKKIAVNQFSALHEVVLNSSRQDIVSPEFTSKKFHGLNQIFQIVKKDILVEMKGFEVLQNTLFYSLMAVFIFGITFSVNTPINSDLFPGIFWVICIFSGIMGFTTSISNDQKHKVFEAILIAPIDAAGIFLAKLFSNFLLIFFSGLFTLFLSSLILSIDLPAFSLFALTLSLGTFGYASVGTLISGITIKSHRSYILPLLLLPLAIPLIIASVQSGIILFSHPPFNNLKNWLGLLLVYDLISVSIGLLTYEFLLKE